MTRPCLRISNCLRTAGALLLAANCCLLTGCGSKNVVYTVTGKVTSNGAPVEVGTIRFESPTTGYATQSPLETEGAYAVKVPPGAYTVVIEPQLIEIRQGAGVDYVYKGGENVPEKYRNSQTTDLRAEIESDATVDFNMPKSTTNY